MTVRPVDGSGDMLPVSDSSQMITGSAAVAQSVADNLRLMRGEWWEDDSIGMLIPDYFANSIKYGDIPVFASYLSSAISRMEGVNGVANVETSYENREMRYSCTIITNEGNENMEVELDGLL